MPKRLAMVGRLCARWNQTVHTNDLPAHTDNKCNTWQQGVMISSHRMGMWYLSRGQCLSSISFADHMRAEGTYLKKYDSTSLQGQAQVAKRQHDGKLCASAVEARLQHDSRWLVVKE